MIQNSRRVLTGEQWQTSFEEVINETVFHAFSWCMFYLAICRRRSFDTTAYCDTDVIKWRWRRDFCQVSELLYKAHYSYELGFAGNTTLITFTDVIQSFYSLLQRFFFLFHFQWSLQFGLHNNITTLCTLDIVQIVPVWWAVSHWHI